MGLEAVELVIEIEDAFDVRLEDADVEQMHTPRDLIAILWRKVEHADAKFCLTQRAFNLLRSTLLRMLPLKRRDITPAAQMGDLVPKRNRKSLLRQLAVELSTDPLPELVRSHALVGLLIGASILAGIGSGFALLQLAPSAGPGGFTFASLLTMAASGLVGWVATMGQCTEFPPLIATVGDLARWVMNHRQDLAARPSGRWTREQIAARVREIVVEQLNCASIYREDASFVQDLGAG